MVNILFIVNSLRAGGAEKHVISLLNGLSTERFRLSLAYLHPGDELLGEIRPGRLAQVLDCRATSRIDRGVIRRLASVIDDDGVDVVLCTNMFAMLYGFLARRQARREVRLVEVFHTTILGDWRLRLQMAFYWPLFRDCDRLVYVCASQRRHWRRLGLRARADAFVHNGIDTEHFSPAAVGLLGGEARIRFGFAPDDLVVGICAGLRPEKAHADLLEAILRLSRSGCPVRCLLIGDGPERPAIERRVVDLGLEGKVVFAGFQSDVRPCIAACDVMAIVSHAVETFSISALEAMALGRPMVMSRIGGAAEQVTDGVNGFTFPAGDIAALAACLEGCREAADRERMGANARAIVVEHFGVALMVQRYEALLGELPAGSGRAR